MKDFWKCWIFSSHYPSLQWDNGWILLH